MELVPVLLDMLGFPLLSVGGQASLPSWREALVSGDDD